ncbi:MAG: hypothetical protein AAGA86_07800, partial [Bacteroidota bacterium]
MRLLLFSLIAIVLWFQRSPAQTETGNLSLSFKDLTRLEVLEKIEQSTGYRFYFVTQWLGEDRISGTYERVSLNTLLEDVFKDTVINFFILDDQTIILTPNTVIRDQLHPSFYED